MRMGTRGCRIGIGSIDRQKSWRMGEGTLEGGKKAKTGRKLENGKCR